MKFPVMLLCCTLAIAPLLAQSSKETKKTTQKQEAAAPKKSDGEKSGNREKIKASSGDEAGTAKGIISNKK